MSGSKVIAFLRVISVFSFFLSSVVRAGITVYPIETSVGDKGVSQIQVMSRGDQVAFVKVTEKKIINAGTPEEKETEADMTGKGALIITPQKIAVSPGGERTVRLVVVDPPEKETTWRVYFEEVSGRDFNDISEVPDSKKTSAEVGVNFVWGALVHVAPQHPVISLKIDGRTGKLINDGTLRIPLTETGMCFSSGECRWHKEEATLYPDTRVKVKSLNLQVGTEYRARFKNWLSGKSEEILLPVIAGSE